MALNGTSPLYAPDRTESAHETARAAVVRLDRGWARVNMSTEVPDRIADAMVAEVRKRVLGIKGRHGAAQFRDTPAEEAIRQSALDEVLALLQDYDNAR